MVRHRLSRPSAIHRMPPSADRLIATALKSTVIMRNVSQLEALETLNDELAGIGLPAVSNSSWFRFVSLQRRLGIEPRWRPDASTDEADFGTVSIPRSRYIELLEIENAHLRQGRI